MKIISNLSKLMPILFLALTFSSCSDDDDGNVVTTDPTIVDVAQSTNNLSILVQALVAADGDLPNVLSGNGPFTVLAPTDDAFEDFLDANDFESLEDVPTDLLTMVLMNHVISGEVSSNDLISAGAGYTTTLATGPNNSPISLYYNTSNGVVDFNGMSSVVTPDVEASNGTIHIVDQVIALPTIATFATANPALSNLVAALQLADSQDGDDDPMLIPALSDASNLFTVFAPTDDAFASLLTELDPDGMTALADLEPSLVEAVLSYHVIAGANVTSTDLTTATVTTLGGDIDIDATNLTITDPNARVSNIIPSLVNIQAVNGVVHAIDKVILPLQSDSDGDSDSDND